MIHGSVLSQILKVNMQLLYRLHVFCDLALAISQGPKNPCEFLLIAKNSNIEVRFIRMNTSFL